MTITMETFIQEDELHYRVWDGDAEGGDFSDARLVWEQRVPLMQTAAYRAGGYHTTAAAREQQRIATAIANEYANGRRTDGPTPRMPVPVNEL